MTHKFSEISFSTPPSAGLPGGATDLTRRAVGGVTEVYDRGVVDIDVIAFYAKVLDVGAKSASIKAPSFTAGASKLACGYKIALETRDRKGQAELPNMAE